MLESNDMKSELLRKSAKHREELEEEVKLISERTEKILINALIIGGSLAATYFLLRQFSGGKPKKRRKKSKAVKMKVVNTPDAEEEEESYEPSEPGIVAQIGSALASQATVFLLELAKEKLAEYLNTSTAKKKEDRA